MALGAEIIYFIRSYFINQIGQMTGNREVAVVEIDPRLGVMEILVKVINAVCVEGAGPADKAVDLIALVEQQLRQIGTILTGDACNERFFHNYLRVEKVSSRPTFQAPSSRNIFRMVSRSDFL